MIKKERVRIQKGDHVATAVWTWLQKEKAVELVPWVDDPIQLAKQEERKEVLNRLEQVIREASTWEPEDERSRRSTSESDSSGS